MKSKAIPVQVHVEYHRIVDKKSYFRASCPDEIYVRIVAKLPNNNSVILREEVFTETAKAREIYDQFREALK